MRTDIDETTVGETTVVNGVATQDSDEPGRLIVVRRWVEDGTPVAREPRTRNEAR